MKVLLSAFSCSPGFGSEPNVGWNVALQAACRGYDVWVLTVPANRDRIGAGLRRLDPDRVERLRFVYVEAPAGVRRLAELPLLGTHYAYYCAWQIVAYLKARELHRSVGFDLVHHVTYVNPWAPTLMGRLGLPFIWSAGTVDPTPAAFLREMSAGGALAELRRNAVLATFGRVNMRWAGRRAKLILTSSDVRRWPEGLPVLRMPLGGLDEEDLKLLGQIPPKQESSPFTVISVGRLLGWKGLGLAVKAFARLREAVPGARYWIVGDGPERPWLEKLSAQLGLQEAVKFWGQRTRQEVFELLAQADILLHPSLHEQFGYAVLESMAAGRPAVCLATGGPELIVGDAGFVIAADRPGNTVRRLAESLAAMARDRTLTAEKGALARKRAQTCYSWDAVGTKILDLYVSSSGATSAAERR